MIFFFMKDCLFYLVIVICLGVNLFVYMVEII